MKPRPELHETKTEATSGLETTLFSRP